VDTSGNLQLPVRIPFYESFGKLPSTIAAVNQFADRPNFAPGVTDITIDYSNPNNVFNVTTPQAWLSAVHAARAGTIGNVDAIASRANADKYGFRRYEKLSLQRGPPVFSSGWTSLIYSTRLTSICLRGNLQVSGGVPTSSTAGTITSD